MTRPRTTRPWLWIAVAAVLGPTTTLPARALPPSDEESPASASISSAVTQEQQVVVAVEEPKPHAEIYGFAMVDAGYDFKQVDPDYFDVLRTSRLPSFANQFGEDGNFYAGVRQSRFGVKGYLPTAIGEVKTIFEFDLFGVVRNHLAADAVLEWRDDLAAGRVVLRVRREAE